MQARAYRSAGRSFASGATAGTLRDGDEQWQIDEHALVGPGGEELARLPGHVAYRFAWQAFIEGAPLAAGEP